MLGNVGSGSFEMKKCQNIDLGPVATKSLLLSPYFILKGWQTNAIFFVILHTR